MSLPEKDYSNSETSHIELWTVIRSDESHVHLGAAPPFKHFKQHKCTALGEIYICLFILYVTLNSYSGQSHPRHAEI